MVPKPEEGRAYVRYEIEGNAKFQNCSADNVRGSTQVLCGARGRSRVVFGRKVVSEVEVSSQGFEDAGDDYDCQATFSGSECARLHRVR